MKNTIRRAFHSKGFRAYCTFAIVLSFMCALPALASGDPIRVIGNLSTFMFSVIRAIGLILLGFGVVQIGLSLKGHDPSQRANGFMTLAGGVVIMFAKESASVTRRNQPVRGLM